MGFSIMMFGIEILFIAILIGTGFMVKSHYMQKHGQHIGSGMTGSFILFSMFPAGVGTIVFTAGLILALLGI